MTAFLAGDDDGLMDRFKAAEYLDLKNPDTLAVWRCTKRYNIPFVKVGRNVRYRKSDLDNYLISRLVK